MFGVHFDDGSVRTISPRCRHHRGGAFSLSSLPGNTIAFASFCEVKKRVHGVCLQKEYCALHCAPLGRQIIPGIIGVLESYRQQHCFLLSKIKIKKEKRRVTECSQVAIPAPLKFTRLISIQNPCSVFYFFFLIIPYPAGFCCTMRFILYRARDLTLL